MALQLVTVLLLALHSAAPLPTLVEGERAGALKAASPLTNCGCQCAPLTFRDSQGTVQGNCRTVDGTGAQWCYVDPHYSSCQDLTPSARFPANPWSYEACATPTIGSYECPAIVAAVPAPHHPVPAPQYPVLPAVEIPYSPYPEVVITNPILPPTDLDCRIPISGCPGFAPPVGPGVLAPTGAQAPGIFPDNVRLGLNSNAVQFGEPTK